MGLSRVRQPAGESKIGHPHRPGRVDQKVRRFDVAVDDSVVMGVRECFGRLQSNLGNPSKIGGSARRIEGRLADLLVAMWCRGARTEPGRLCIVGLTLAGLAFPLLAEADP